MRTVYPSKAESCRDTLKTDVRRFPTRFEPGPQINSAPELSKGHSATALGFHLRPAASSLFRHGPAARCRAREYLAQERTTMPTILQVAAANGAADTLDELFSEGVDANLRADDATDFSDVESDWATYEPPPDFDPEDDDGWYPLYRAARLSKNSDKCQHAHTVTTLLRHGADLYRVYGQALRPPREGSRSQYPGEDVPPKHQFSDNEDEEENVKR